jgi:hypothetical protein
MEILQRKLDNIDEDYDLKFKTLNIENKDLKLELKYLREDIANIRTKYDSLNKE